MIPAAAGVLPDGDNDELGRVLTNPLLPSPNISGRSKQY
jgi:hypothetical protein